MIGSSTPSSDCSVMICSPIGFGPTPLPWHTGPERDSVPRTAWAQDKGSPAAGMGSAIGGEDLPGHNRGRLQVERGSYDLLYTRLYKESSITVYNRIQSSRRH